MKDATHSYLDGFATARPVAGVHDFTYGRQGMHLVPATFFRSERRDGRQRPARGAQETA